MQHLTVESLERQLGIKFSEELAAELREALDTSGDPRYDTEEGSEEYELVYSRPDEYHFSIGRVVEDYRRIKSQNPPNVNALLACGRELLEIGRETNHLAVDAFLTVTRLAPHRAEGFFWLGEAYLFAKEYDPAARAYEACLRLDPGHNDARAALFQVRNLAGS